ncbi:MFS transporter [Kribbella solani]|uniref:EmrB/QacA subfamily drug resistance transporter n=1 Tax=Kribbella solani TaxID=236067 RepID=A0A841DTJ0_9ACTN|nr:MFS transporter [Kribbella solani]MBB5980040.1 EmrB/QacA subfamily drug resistance transporter [Kribbella solani]
MTDKPSGGWWPLAAICLIDLMLLGDVGLVTVALPRVQADFGVGLTSLQWITNVYSLTLAAFLLTAGSIADRLGRRRVLLPALGLFLVAQVGNAMAPNATWLLSTRFLEGTAAAMMYAVSLTLLSETYHGRYRGIAFGVWGAFTGGSIALGPILGGLLVGIASWRWVFLAQVPICLAAIAITRWRVPRGEVIGNRRTDWWGAVLFTPALTALVYLITWGRHLAGFWIITLAGTSLVLFATFAVVELRVKYPMFDVRRLRNRAFSGAQLAAFAGSATHFALLLYLMIFLQSVQGHTPLQAGLIVLAMSGPTFLVAPLTGRLVGRFPPHRLVALGLAVTGAGLFALRGFGPGDSWRALLPGFVVIGIGAGIFNPMLGALAMSVVPRAEAGAGSGISYSFRQLGLATGIAVNGAVLGAGIHSSVAQQLAGLPAQQVDAVAGAVSSGGIARMIAALPEAQRDTYARAAVDAYTAGLHGVFLVAGWVALGAAAVVIALGARPVNVLPGATTDRAVLAEDVSGGS